jgi:hypothetical protein
MFNRLIPFLCIFLMTSCAALLRERTHHVEMERESEGVFVAGRDFNIIPGDSTEHAFRSRDEVQRRTPASRYERKQMTYRDSLKKELDELEEELSVRELKRYKEDTVSLKISEKIYYLQLPRQERSSFLGMIRTDRPQRRFYSKKKRARSSYYTQNFMPENSQSRSYRDQREINVGMDKRTVVGLWGKPSNVDVAGNPRHENERWTFSEDGAEKVIYFESGLVNGWQIQ